MYQTINLHQFREAFRTMGRENFSYEGLELLFDYLEECDPDYDLDVIALCCDYAESSIREIIDDYSIDVEGVDHDDLSDHVESFLNKNTMVVGTVADGFIYQQF